MNGITIDRFGEFFKELHGHDPYPWQARLTALAVKGIWPDAIDLPTGSGKTACIDIAVFAMACQASLPAEQRTAPRRIFFCVNRRVIVDEAYQRATKIARRLQCAFTGENDAKCRCGRAPDGKPACLDGKDERTPPCWKRPDLVCVAKALGGIANNNGEAPPLDVLELRGGIYRDNRWARSITQPTIVCTTIDQLGSRLLFRGYGVSSNAAPIQAALIAYDSLILLDEAHISNPFLQTLEFVRRYLDPTIWAEQDIGVKPAVVVPMTATPPKGIDPSNVIRILHEDRNKPQNQSLNLRLEARKPAELRETKNVAEDVVDAARELAKGKAVSVGIIVNRIATAKTIYEELAKLKEEVNGKKRKIDPNAAVELIIGSMRPIDRDKQAEQMRDLVGPNRPAVTKKPSFIVATQCLEVGADYDFDVLVTECASLDALRQRFGRLNRAGRDIEAKGVIVAKKQDIKPEDKLDDEKPLDPIYGNALPRTWNWLNEHATEVTDDSKSAKMIDFGIDAFDELLKEHGEDGRIPKSLLAPSALLDAPVMLPAYLDFWCQTTPHPVPDPDVSLFLHGPQRSEPDVQVCWRADLGTEDNHPDPKHWCDVVALLPPTSAECMRVPIGRLKAWLNEADATERAKQLRERDDNDLYNTPGDDAQTAAQFQVDGVVWRGMNKSKRLADLNKKNSDRQNGRTTGKDDALRPGDTLVLPVSAGGWDKLGHIPPLKQVSTRSGGQATDGDSASQTPVTAENNSIAGRDALRIDVAEDAFQKARDRAVLRLHPSMRHHVPESDAIIELFKRAADKENPPNKREWPKLLNAAADAIDQAHPLADDLRKLASPKYGLRPERYPDRRGFILTTRRRIGAVSAWSLPSLDEGDDELSRTQREQPILLAEHTQHVVDTLSRSLPQLPLKQFAAALKRAAELHDLGKADERFQAMLRRTDRTDAWLLAGVTSALLAKSDGTPLTHSEYNDARRRAGLPDGFRHEMLSVQLADRSGRLPDDPTMRELLFHLIATHHGHARPFAPVVVDEELPAVEVDDITLSHEERINLIPPHRLDSGVAERFWSLTRRFGWWGLAYLEAVLRLADSQASAAEDAGEYGDDSNARAHETAEAIA